MSESSTYTHVTGTLSGLQYQAQNYDAFEFNLYKWNGSAWDFVGTRTESPYDWYYQYSVYTTWTAQAPNTAYYVKGWAKYGGTWYGFVSGTWTTSPAIPYATFSNASTQKTTITFDYTNTVGTLALNIWNGSAWVGIAASGVPYSVSSITNGYRITLNTLVPNGSYYFIVTTTIEGWYSSAPSGSPGYQTYTTTAWPTISGVVSVNARYEGGYYLDWGDHGFEGSGFDYALYVDSTNVYRYTDNGANPFTTNDYGVSHSFQVAPGKYAYPSSGIYGWYQGTYTSSVGLYTAPKRPGGITLNSTTTKSFNLTASSMTANYSAVEWRWRVNGSGGAFSASIDYGGGLTKLIDSLIHNTTYEIQCWSYHGTSGLYSVDYRSLTPTTNLLSVGSPTNVSVLQAAYTLSVDVYYSWGSNATDMEFRWSNDAATWNNFTGQTNNLYPAANYNVGIVAYGNKYFQVRSRRTDGTNIVYSSYVNATPYPLLTITAPAYRTKAYVSGSWQLKPCKVYLGGTWQTKPAKYYNGSTWV